MLSFLVTKKTCLRDLKRSSYVGSGLVCKIITLNYFYDSASNKENKTKLIHYSLHRVGVQKSVHDKKKL